MIVRILPKAGLPLFLALAGSLTVTTDKAHAQAPGTVPYRPTMAARYYYNPRTGGYYYAYPQQYTVTRPAARSGNGYAPGSIYYSSTSPFVRDFSTARDLPLAKPWMRPLR